MGYGPEKRREYQRKWVADKMKDPQAHAHRLQIKRAWREKNKDKIRIKEAEYRLRNKHKIKPPRSPEQLEKKRQYNLKYSRKRIALVNQNPEAHKIHLEKRRKWAQAYRESNREKLVQENREYRQKEKKVHQMKVDAGIKTKVDAKVFAKKRTAEANVKAITKKRMKGREKMIECLHASGFTFEQHPLGGVTRKCNGCGKKFRQIGR